MTSFIEKFLARSVEGEDSIREGEGEGEREIGIGGLPAVEEVSKCRGAGEGKEVWKGERESGAVSVPPMRLS